MSNPMLRALNQTRLSGQIAPIRQMMQTVRNAGNPQAMLAQMMQKNPHVAQVMQLVQQSGGDAKAAFYQAAQNLGVNGDEIINMLK